MVSYFLPRGRFLIKAGNLREAQKQTKWPVRWTFRRTLTTKPQDSKVDSLISGTKIQQKSSATIATNKESSLKRLRNPWFSWSGLLLRWAPMGFCVFGAIEWQWHRNKVQKENLPRTASDFQTKVYCSLPLRIISRCWGWLASCYIPTNLRPFVYGWYSNSFGVNLEEALHSDLTHYESLAEFFTRPLKEGARVVDPHCALVSPADGKVLHFSTASESVVEQVKGINYRIDSFLGPNSWVKSKDSSVAADYAEAIRMNKNEQTAIFQCVIYLAPGDYHRFHSPADWEPQIRRHFTGELLSVSPKIATWLPGLFCVNERALYIGKWLHGFFSFTAVGATNVGSVKIYVDEQLKTNRWVGLKVGSHKTCSEFEELQLPEGTKLGKGDLLGQFNMGSTVVLLFEAPKDFKFHIKEGQTIRMGEPLGYVQKK
ncbi:phosphatidylserine decarboxylase proenzyme, mitochondrial [Eupeodes corollae]|uniref:phosphatidylserine decarboxylase proenzyme, mitochondrial n=1 Tax=Eupeodes corollae TaxID=290404 RepID=UPI002490259F|nr:phosphatidylserine decarboxylase proenzyme, mitochondrial [Eupeodes corollae]